MPRKDDRRFRGSRDRTANSRPGGASDSTIAPFEDEDKPQFDRIPAPNSAVDQQLEKLGVPHRVSKGVDVASLARQER